MDMFKKVLAWFAFIPICIRVFMRWTPLAVGLAAIPIEQHIVKPMNLGPLTSKVVSFVMLFGLMLISWHFGEIIVALMAVACVAELWLLVECVGNRIRETRDAELAMEATL